ncbi:hypothetical protein [Parapedobacter indicus]|uniref:Uncharacterized protein n=1 Tax=Parapedobacter indicus TaxID=1477437 RepID=A0A1I3V475_9SPHI|nr:hypothetical protein [Parapedobacter indicus]PPK98997.1 hypothetical protein CLV26_11527 [Parapedobacter indicus]SFJ89146.1 hypothetical protein SAMN05444682_115150 [Parapedobacter indicus]
MKKLLFIAAITIAACSKEQLPETQSVTYQLNCKDCVIYLEDDKWNHYNELDRSKFQYFNVKGSFTYTFDNVGQLDTVNAKVFVSVFNAAQRIDLTISENLRGKSVRLVDTLGLPYALENKVKLPLR